MSGKKSTDEASAAPAAAAAAVTRGSNKSGSSFNSFLIVVTLGALFGVAVLNWQLLNQNQAELQRLNGALESVRKSVADLAAAPRAAPSATPSAAAADAAHPASSTPPPAADEDNVDPDVRKLTTANFDATLAGPQQLTLVEFYAPWCGHCKKLAPEYQKLALIFNKDPSSQVVIAKVDATQESEVAEKYGVQGYPTIKLFIKGVEKPKEFRGERTSEGLKRYLEGQLGPAFVQLNSVDEIQQFQQKNSLAVFGFVNSAADEHATAFQSVAAEHREKFKFALVVGQALATKAGVSAALPVMRVARHFSKDKPADYTGSFSSDKDVRDFLSSSSIPLWGELTNENASDFLATGKPLVVLFLSAENLKRGHDFVQPFLSVAAKYTSRLTFVFLDGEKFSSHKPRLGLPNDKNNVLAVDDYQNGLKYPFTGELTPDALDAFFADWAAGSLESHVRSEPIPETNDEPVKVLVGKNFKELVLDNDKDVLVEFYAPWCGHCKNLEPKYVELAEKMQEVAPNMVIAKMDATANDPPAAAKVKVQGFPTIFFFKGGAKDKPIEFNGSRDVEGFIKFLKENATHKFDA